MAQVFYRKRFSSYLGEQRAIDDIITSFVPDGPIPSPTPSPTPSATPITPTPTQTPTTTPTPTTSVTPTLTPSITPTNTVTPTLTTTPTTTPTPSPIVQTASVFILSQEDTISTATGWTVSYNSSNFNVDGILSPTDLFKCVSVFDANISSIYEFEITGIPSGYTLSSQVYGTEYKSFNKLRWTVTSLHLPTIYNAIFEIISGSTVIESYTGYSQGAYISIGASVSPPCNPTITFNPSNPTFYVEEITGLLTESDEEILTENNTPIGVNT